MHGLHRLGEPSGIRNGDVKPGVSVMFNLVFKNLGEVGGTLLSVPAGLL